MSFQSTIIFILGFLILITAMLIILTGFIGVLITTIDAVFDIDLLSKIKQPTKINRKRSYKQ